MESQLGIGDILNFIKHRKKTLVISFLIIFSSVVVVALSLPPLYKAETTILRESQQVSEDYIRSTDTDYAEQRLDMATQQVMSRSNLVNIINLYNLYPEMREKKTMGEIVSKMRRSIQLENIYAKVANERIGRAVSINTAFKLSYEGRDPLKTQKVANTLASLYIELEVQERGKRAMATTTFLENELEILKEQIRVYEEKIRRFKEMHLGKLPENYNLNLRTFDNLERDLERVEGRIRTLEERRLFIEGQLATVDPLLPIKTNKGKVLSNPGERLKRLHLELMTMQVMLSEKHPDVKRLKNEIQELEKQVGRSDEAVMKIKRLKDLEEEYAVSKGKLGEKHPDLIRLEKEIETLTADVDQMLTERIKGEVSEEKPDNPTYINLKTQIFVAEAEIRNLNEDKKEIEEAVEEYRDKIEKTPLVEKEYIELTRDYSGAKRKYDDISSKLMEARVAKGMAESQFSERFVIVDPAALPEKPHKPHRMAIILLGFIFAFGFGTGLAVIQESMDHSIQSVDELNQITGGIVFSVISFIETPKEKRNRRIKRIIWSGSILSIIIVVLFVVNQLMLPLDKLWIEIWDRLSIV